MDRTSEIVAAARTGSEDAWRRLVAAHQQGLVRLAWALTGDRQRAVELAHDAFVEAFLNIRKLRDNQAFGAWLRTILVRTARRARRHNSLNEREISHLRTPQRELLGKEFRQAVDHAIRALKPIHREALALAMDGDFSSAQAAQLLGCSPGAYRVRLHEARRRLREMLAEFLME